MPRPPQENYLNHRPKIAGDDAQRLRIIAKAAEGISAGDVATRAVRQYQNWSLMPFAGGWVGGWVGEIACWWISLAVVIC